MTEEITYQVRLTETQLIAIRDAAEMVARLHMGQFDVLQNMNDTFKLTWDACQVIKRMAQPDLPINAYYGIFAQELPEQARILWDIYQATRHTIAWDHAPNTPETRDWHTQMSVIYDTPMHTAKEPLPMVSKVEQKVDK